MRRVILASLVLLGLWLLSAIGVGIYYAADGGHGGRPSVILVSVGLGAIFLLADAVLIWKLWAAEKRPA